MKNHQLAIGEALDVSLDPAGTTTGRGIEGRAGVFSIVATCAAVGANLFPRERRPGLIGAHRLRRQVTPSDTGRPEAIEKRTRGSVFLP